MRRALGIVVVVVTLGALGLAPTVASAQARPDLVVESVVPSLGTPQHIIIDNQGYVIPFKLRITTKNVGHAVAGISETAIYAIGQGASRPTLVALSAVGRLQPGQSATKTAMTPTFLKLPLGITTLKAIADNRSQVRESNENNNQVTAATPATIPFQWNVSLFVTVEGNPIGQSATTAEKGFRWLLEKGTLGTQKFVYQPYGDVMNSQNSTSESVCSTHGQSTASGVPWVDSTLEISHDLTSYEALVGSSKAARYFVTLKCLGGVSYQEEVGFTDLVTGEGDQRTTPGAATLSGSETDSMLMTTWTWKFTADIG